VSGCSTHWKSWRKTVPQIPGVRNVEAVGAKMKCKQTEQIGRTFYSALLRAILISRALGITLSALVAGVSQVLTPAVFTVDQNDTRPWPVCSRETREHTGHRDRHGAAVNDVIIILYLQDACNSTGYHQHGPLTRAVFTGVQNDTRVHGP